VTDVTTGQDQVQSPEPGLSAADEQVLRELTERARAGGLKLTGEGGLLGKLTKMVIEGALEGELDGHLGYEKNDPAGRNGGNSRNGYRAKTVLTRYRAGRGIGAPRPGFFVRAETRRQAAAAADRG
jgi:putative transposase